MSSAARSVSIFLVFVSCSSLAASSALSAFATACSRLLRSLSHAASSFRRALSRRFCSLSNASAASRAALSPTLGGLRFFRLPSRLYFPLVDVADGQVSRQFGMLFEWAIRSNWPPQNDAWFGHRGSNNCGVMGFFGETSLELIRLQTPGVRRRFHGWRSDGQIEEPKGGLIGLESPHHQSHLFWPPMAGGPE